MMDAKYFNQEEKAKMLNAVRQLMRMSKGVLQSCDFKILKQTIKSAIENGHYRKNKYGINPVVHNIETALMLCNKISPDRNMIVAIILHNICQTEYITVAELEKQWGADVAKLVSGLLKVATLYSRQAAVESDNFRNLLLTFAEDIRVIIIMIVDRLVLMRAINHHPNEKYVHDVAYEANYLYAPLAHRLGLYVIKSELEDLSLKYTNREKFTEIARKLNETKVERDEYISSFIGPVKKKLEEAGLVLGMTKSQIFFRVKLLQMVKRIIPPMSNEIITLVKDTSLARIIALQEIIWAGQAFLKGSNGISGAIWPLFFTGVYYLIFSGLLTILLGKLEKKLDYFR